MKAMHKREKVDLLINHLWKDGYLTLSRKYGKYLPAPPSICGYEVDAISKYKKKYAIGIKVSEEELNDPKFISRIENILRFRNLNPENKVTLYIGVPNELLLKAQILISSLEVEKQKNIKIIPLSEK